MSMQACRCLYVCSRHAWVLTLWHVVSQDVSDSAFSCVDGFPAIFTWAVVKAIRIVSPQGCQPALKFIIVNQEIDTVNLVSDRGLTDFLSGVMACPLILPNWCLCIRSVPGLNCQVVTLKSQMFIIVHNSMCLKTGNPKIQWCITMCPASTKTTSHSEVYRIAHFSSCTEVQSPALLRRWTQGKVGSTCHWVWMNLLKLLMKFS